jgi:hypothetical protein
MHTVGNVYKLLRLQTHLVLLGLGLQAFGGELAEQNLDARGRQFIGFDSFGAFSEISGPGGNEKILISPEIRSRINFNEVIVSWNADTPREAYLAVEAQAIYAESTTKYYSLGLWSTDPALHPRRSVAGQNDSEAQVATDVLVLHRPACRLRIRVLHGGTGSGRPALKFLGISLTDTNALLPQLPPNRAAWGKRIPVAERSQMIYPNGKALCSPTTVSMLMGYWAEKLGRPELDLPVPDIAKAIYDSQWLGTGNWPFNMAYAGSFAGMRAYVTRLSDVSELETWIANDLPIGLSVDYDRLRAKGPGPNGHLVACVGFTKSGDPIVNDPGTSEHVRKVFPRQNLIDAWACARNTVYLIYPQSSSTPDDPFGHWDSKSSRRRTTPSP